MKYLEYDIFNVRSHNYRYQARDHLHVLNIEEKMMTGPTLEKAITELYCSVELTNVHDELIVLSTLNIFLSITAFLGNTLIFTALRRKNSLYPPSKLLYRTLAITDLCVGVVVQPLCVAYLMSVKNERWDICYNFYMALFVASYILCAVSLFILTAISVDRLLALLLGLRYRQVVTLKRTHIAVIGLWIMCIVGGASKTFWNTLITSWYLHIITVLCLVITISAYTKIFLSLRHNQIHVQNHVAQGQPSQAIPLNIARYRKAVYSALWVQVTLFVCYLPFCITQVFITHLKSVKFSPSVYLAKTFSFTLVFLNSSLNPLLYCWKIKEVRQAVKDTVREIYRSLTS